MSSSFTLSSVLNFIKNMRNNKRISSGGVEEGNIGLVFSSSISVQRKVESYK